MSAPGTSYVNPIWYRGYRIYRSEFMMFAKYAFQHDDFDGADDSNDNRAGYGQTVEECKEAIDEMENDQ